MGRTNIPDTFDFLDPDLIVEKGLPVEELAELRRAEPIHWVSVPGGTGGFGDHGYWLVTKHADVKEVSRRNDVFSSWLNGAIPVWPHGMSRELAVDLQRNVLLNMDAPHHDRLRKIISRGFTPRAIGALKDELNARAQNIAKNAAAAGSGDFVEQVACELPLQAIAELLGVPQEDRDKLFRWSNEMTAGEDPEFAGVDPQLSSFEVIAYAHKMAEERGKNPTGDIVTQLIQADIEGEKLTDDEFCFFVIMLAVAGNETSRNSTTHGMVAFTQFPDQWELFKRERPATAVRSASFPPRIRRPFMFHFSRPALAASLFAAACCWFGHWPDLFYHLIAQTHKDAAMEAFTVRDLRERTGELIRGAEDGHLSVVTKHGNPVFVAVPFDEVLLESGVRVSLALRLFDDGTLTLAQAAKVAGVGVETFIEHVGAAGLTVVRTPADELDWELEVIAQHERSR